MAGSIGPARRSRLERRCATERFWFASALWSNVATPRKFIIPVRIDDVSFGELPIQIHQLNAIDFTSGRGVRCSGSRRIGYAAIVPLLPDRHSKSSPFGRQAKLRSLGAPINAAHDEQISTILPTDPGSRISLCARAASASGISLPTTG